jgi:hypothetical protein
MAMNDVRLMPTGVAQPSAKATNTRQKVAVVWRSSRAARRESIGIAGGSVGFGSPSHQCGWPWRIIRTSGRCAAVEGRWGIARSLASPAQ